MSVWTSSVSLGTCPECCGGTCPCDVGTMPTTLTGTITFVSGSCSTINGNGINLSYVGGSWSGSTTGSCSPGFASLACIDTGGGVYKFRLVLSFGADMSIFADSTYIRCSPARLEFTGATIFWSGSNGSSLCCPQGPDTFALTPIGVVDIVIT